MIKKMWLLSLMLLAGAASAAESDTFRNAAVGFQITKAESWQFLAMEESQAGVVEVKLGEPEFKETLQKYANTPLVVMTKYPEPYDDLNPSIKVQVRSFAQHNSKDARQVLVLIAAQLRNVFKDFVIEQAPTDTVLSGIKSAYVRISYSMQLRDGRVFPTTSEMWVVPRGDHFFLIAADTRQDDAVGSRSEIEKIVRSAVVSRGK